MDTHVKSLGFATLLYGIVAAVTGILALVFAGGLYDLWAYFDDANIGLLVAAIVVLQLLTVIPNIIGGINIRRFHPWARTLLIVTSALNVLTPPVGTVLGIYGLWVLLSPEVEPLFHDTPPNMVYRAKTKKNPGKGSLRNGVKLPVERLTED